MLYKMLFGIISVCNIHSAIVFLTEMELCPYSQPTYTEFTDDHIFPQYLGGRRTIRVCKQCNNVFGHTFEGRASRQLMGYRSLETTMRYLAPAANVREKLDTVTMGGLLA